MASRMSEGEKVSLALVTLGHIYQGLADLTTQRARSCFALHFVLGWMTEYFDGLYSNRADTPRDLPFLAKYAGIRGTTLTLAQARGIFRHPDTANYHCIPFGDSLG